MRTTWTWMGRIGVAVVLGAHAGAAAVQTLPNLPAALTIARSADSPGPVVFDHRTHVDSSRPACTPCHPREFRILRTDAGPRLVLHANFEKGRQCGSCHNGKKAFTVDDDCTNCHRISTR